MSQNTQFTDWFSFTRSLELHFGASTYVNHQAKLFKLHQIGFVTDYQVAFENSCNRIVGLTPDIILNYFIFGLTPCICKEISIHHLIPLPRQLVLLNFLKTTLEILALGCTALLPTPPFQLSLNHLSLLSIPPITFPFKESL